MKQTISYALLICLLLLCASCASIVKGSTQTIHVAPEPPEPTLKSAACRTARPRLMSYSKKASRRGYEVKAKAIWYYKCCTIGCGVNKNANVLHERFANMLGLFSIDYDSKVIGLIKTQAIATFNQFTKGYQIAHPY